MIDREKVIKALECRKNADKRCGNPCEETGLCHYATAVRGLDGEIYKPFICDRESICADAIALLKEQEAVRPKSKVRHGAYAQIQHFCGNCNTMLHGKPKYCSECGKAVLW